MKENTNPLECECGHVAGAPATLRIHKSTVHGAGWLAPDPGPSKPKSKRVTKKK